MNKRPNISRAELEVLHHVTERHPATVREVAEHFQETRGWARTTLLTLLERLRGKGYLERTEGEGPNRYLPTVSRAELLGLLVRDFVQRGLRGSIAPVMTYLGEADLSDEELDALRRLVREQERRKEGQDE
jgi:predicted transcriptional regulator